MSDTALPDGLMPLIKTATRSLVLACAAPGQTGPQRVEQLTGYSQGVISRWIGEAYPAVMPLEVVGLLEAAIGKPLVTRLFASLTGHKLEPVAAPEAAPLDLMAEVFRSTGSHARFTAAAADAWEDQKITPGEAKALLQAVMKHVEDMGAIATRLAKLAGG